MIKPEAPSRQHRLFAGVGEADALGQVKQRSSACPIERQPNTGVSLRG